MRRNKFPLQVLLVVNASTLEMAVGICWGDEMVETNYTMMVKTLVVMIFAHHGRYCCIAVLATEDGGTDISRAVSNATPVKGMLRTEDNSMTCPSTQ